MYTLINVIKNNDEDEELRFSQTSSSLPCARDQDRRTTRSGGGGGRAGIRSVTSHAVKAEPAGVYFQVRLIKSIKIETSCIHVGIQIVYFE